MSMRGLFTILVTGVAVLLVLPESAEARKQYLPAIKKAYSLDDATKCTLCHALSGNENATKKNLNAFGKDVQKKLDGKSNEAFLAAVKAVEALDSDGDGATNLEEMKLGSAPGENTSKPDSKKLEEYRKANPVKK